MPNRQSGFSLIELMIAMAISGFVLAGIYGAYQDQLMTSMTQERIVDLNQNLRAAIVTIERDLRMGGANPTGAAPAGITTAEAGFLVVATDNGGTDNDLGNNSNALDDNADNDMDGIVDEGSDGNDNDGDLLIDEADEAEWFDGDVTDQGEVIRFDLDSGNLRRRFNSAASTDPTVNSTRIARNIDALNFVYFDGADPPNVLPTPVTGGARDDIRSVQVTIVARDGVTLAPMARNHTDNNIYTNQQGDVLLDMSAAPDGFRRRMVTTTIKCRNLGL